MAGSVQNAGMATIILSLDQARLGSGLAEAQNKIKSFARSVSEMSDKLAMIGVVTAYPMASVLKVFSEFDDQMRMVSAVTGVTGDEFKKLTDLARKLGRETSFTTKEVAEGMLSLGRMGFSSSEIQSAIADVMNLSRATGTSLADAALIASNNLRMFKLEASQMTDVADIMTVTANGSAQTLIDLGEAFKMAGPRAAQAGESLLDTAASIGVLANMGIKGSLAGTALARSFQQMTTPDVIATLNSVGVSTADANGNLRKMKDILKDVAIAMSGMGSQQAGKFITDIFDIRGSLGGGVLTANIDQINKMNVALSDFSGKAAIVSKAADAGVGGALRELQSSVEGAAIAIGDTLAKALSPAIAAITNFSLASESAIDRFSWILKPIAQITMGIVTVGTAFKGLTIGLWAFKAIYAPVAALNGAVVRLTGSALAKARAMTVAASSAYALNRSIALLTVCEKGALITGRRHVVVTNAVTLASKGAAAATIAMGTAMNFVKANAFTIMMIALVSAVSWASSEMRKLEDQFKGMATAAEQATEAARTATEVKAGDNKNAYDKFSRLQQLADMAKLRTLTEAEFKQAEALTAQLEEFGSESFAFTNSAAKGFSLSADAADKFGKAVRNSAIDSLKKEGAALDNQLNILVSRSAGLKQKLSGGSRADGNMVYALGGFEADSKKFDELRVQISAIEKERAELEMKIAAMAKSDLAQALGVTSGETLQQQIAAAATEMENLKTKAEEAATEIDKVFNEESRKNKSTAQVEIEDIAELSKKYSELSATKRASVMATAKHAYLAGDNQTVADSMASVRAIDAQADAYNRMLQERAAAAQKKNGEDYTGFLSAEGTRISGESIVNRGDQAFDIIIDSGNIKALQNFMMMFGKSVDEMKSVYSDYLAVAMDPASQGGALLSDDEKTTLDALRKNITEAMDRLAGYSSKIETARSATNAEVGKHSTNGTYFVDRFFSKLGTSTMSETERTAKASESSLQELKDLNEFLSKHSMPLVIGT